MIPTFAILELGDYAVIAVIVTIIFLVGGFFAAHNTVNLRRVERKLDALLKHHRVELQMPLSPEVQQLAKDPRRKIAAIKLHREQNPGLSLADAKADVEDFARGSL